MAGAWRIRPRRPRSSGFRRWHPGALRRLLRLPMQPCRTDPGFPKYDGFKLGGKRRARLLQDVAKDPTLKNRPGIYLITFEHAGQRKAYSGMSGDLQGRLAQHLYHLSFPVGLTRQYQVYIQLTANEVQARNLEQALNRMRGQLGGVLVNLTTELEAEAFF
jgi:hypothetical protein